MATRLEHLTEMVDGLQRRMDACDSDQNYAVMARVLNDVLVQIDELGGGAQAEPKETGLSDFEKRLRARESTSAPRRAKSG